MTAETIFQYFPGKMLVSVDTPETVLCVADSWLVNDGQTRALHLHRQRFLSSVLSLTNLQEQDIVLFWDAAMAHIPATGLWFPRIELAGSAGNPVFQLRIRKAPALHHTIRLYHSHFADFRKIPRHKGPDLAKCIAMRRNILPAGAEEALITTAQGFILEGLTTTILWWENGTLCHVPPSCRILPGITGQLILRIAGQNGIPVAARMRKPHELNRREVWAVNALHGIRRVINWERTPFQTEVHCDIGYWRNALEKFREPCTPV